jgi:uncharacterized protein YicC (UPF0701 family)
MMVVESSAMGEGEAAAEKMADLFGPCQVDQSIRQAVQFCWMALPQDRRTVEELEKQIRRLVDRALKDFREDREAFGKKVDASPTV